MSAVKRYIGRVVGIFVFVLVLVGLFAASAVAAPSLEVELRSDANEVQAVYVDAAGGQFRLRFGSGGLGVSETGDIAATATAGEVQGALNALSTVSEGGGSVAVEGGPGGIGANSPYEVTFGGGPLAARDVAELEAINGATPLSGGASTVVVKTVDPGGVSRSDERVDYVVKVKNAASAGPAVGDGLTCDVWAGPDGDSPALASSGCVMGG